MPGSPVGRPLRGVLAVVVIVWAVALFASSAANKSPAPPTTFSDFLVHVEKGQVRDATVRTRENSVRVRLENKREYEVGYPTAWSSELTAQLRRADVPFEIEPDRRPWSQTLLIFLLPVVLVIGLAWVILRRRAGSGAIGAFGRARAKQLAFDAPKITFRDVAGVDEAVEELREIVAFSRDPSGFQALGARIPKGVLLY